MTHALIIGGGLAGSLTAIALHEAGIDCTVYEAYPEGASLDVGAWLTVAVNGLDVMRTLGIVSAVKTQGFPSRDIVLVSGTGKRLGVVPIGGELSDGTVTHTMKRTDLYRVLTEEVARRGVPVVYDKRFVSAEDDGAAVVACFDDGTTARGDVLVGADGIHSRVRTTIDPGASGPRYTGHGNVGGFTPASAVALTPGVYEMIFGKRAFFGYTTAPSGETWWFANPPRKTPFDRATLAAMDSAAWKAHLIALFDEDEGPAVELIRSSEGELVGSSQYDLAGAKRWHRGRMLIIGDAAHAASPSSGQGASMAAEDAVTLAVCLRDIEDIPSALATFTRTRRDRAGRVITYGARSSSSKIVGPIGRAIRDTLMPFFLKGLNTEGAKRNLAWLYDHHIDWSRKITASEAA